MVDEMFRNALVSVSDKTGLVEFLKPLAAKGLRIVSTGGTLKFLREHHFQVVDVSEQTGFPEVMGGRVKTLHPKIHMALLSRPGIVQDQEILKSQGLEEFDLLICNLYPFAQSVEAGLQGDELIEKIDIGGPSMLRAAAKNFSRLAVLCDPKDYTWVAGKQELTFADRQQLAARVFSHTSTYDALVAEKLGAGWGVEFSIAGSDTGVELRYGENPQQVAKWYRRMGDTKGLHAATVLQGKPLSYNNILDLDAATLLVRELKGPSAVAVKHNNPCGVASQASLYSAVDLAIKADPVSVFGGIIAVNRTVDLQAAERMTDIFLECIVAPDFSVEALAVLSKKKNLRLLRWPELMRTERDLEVRGVQGGFLVQKPDSLGSEPVGWQLLGQTPSEEVLADLVLAEKISASLKSNAIAIVHAGQSFGLGMGQVNRVDAVLQAIARMQQHHGSKPHNLVLASDAFFPFADSITIAAQAGVRWILQPGGSVKDEEVFMKARDLGVNMILTGRRHFRH